MGRHGMVENRRMSRVGRVGCTVGRAGWLTRKGSNTEKRWRRVRLSPGHL